MRGLLPLLERHRGDIPLDFLLGWVAVESGGCVGVITPSLKERGYFQIHPAELKHLSVDGRPADPELISTDPEYSVKAGIALVRLYMQRAETHLKIKRGTDLFWPMVKFQHTGVGYVDAILNDMRRHGASPTSWAAIREHVNNTENNARLRQHKFFLKRTPESLIGNVDNLLRQGRLLAPRPSGGAAQELYPQTLNIGGAEYEMSFEAEPFEGYTEFDETERLDPEDSFEWSDELRRRRASRTNARRPRVRPRVKPRGKRPRRPPVWRGSAPFYPAFGIPAATLDILCAKRGAGGFDQADVEPTEDDGDGQHAATPPQDSTAGGVAGFDPAGGQSEFDEWEWFDPSAHETNFEWMGEVSRGSAEYVRWVQRSLNRVLGLRLAVDGDAGAQTRSAIRSFQKSRGLQDDGQVGSRTEQALIAAGADPPPTVAAKTTPQPAPATTTRVVSPLANTQRGLRKGWRKRTHPVYGVCVHTTSGGAARAAKIDPRRSALDRVLDFYLRGNEGFPHYVIGYDGAIYGTCSENEIAIHAGWGGNGIQKWTTWKAPEWWSKVWRAQLGPQATPASLLPPKARDPNSVYIGVEMLADTTGYGFTVAQYEALARLVKDIAQRYQLPINSAPSTRLLGHEDVDPISRSNRHGGWDPGAHRDKPMFSWTLLWEKIAAAP